MTKAAAVVREPISSDRRQWEKTINLLGSMLKNQESQIETILQERHYLEDYLQNQHTRWHSKNRTLQYQISQMRKTHELEKSAQDARLEIFLGLKDRVISVLKDQNEKFERNMDNFGECLDGLVQKISNLSADRGEETHEHEVAKLRSEVQNMETAHKKLISMKDSEITALLIQKDLLKTQSKQSGSDLADLHSSKKSKLDENSKSLKKLQSTIKDLRKSANEKDEMITKLRTESNLLVNDMSDAIKKIAKLESDVEELRACVYEKSEIIAKLRRQQLEKSIVLPKSLSRNIKMKSSKKNPVVSPSDNRQGNSSQPRPPESLLQNPKMKSTPVTAKINKEEAFLQTLPRRSVRLQSIGLKGCSNSKEVTAVSSSNPLLSSTFKAPKLKNSRTS